MIADLREAAAKTTVAGTTGSVELPMLQLVCRQLWLKSENGHLTGELYKRMGRAERILRDYVREVMPRSWRGQALTARLMPANVSASDWYP